MQAESLEVLEKADVAPAQARAIVRAIEIEIAGTKDVLATKADVALLRHEMSELRLEVKGDLLRLETKLEGKINEVASSITRQMYTAILGQMAVLLGFAYFFATHVR